MAGEFPIDLLTDRRSRLESTISALEKDQTRLTAHLEAMMLSAEQIQTLKELRTIVVGNLNPMDGDFYSLRGLIEALDV